jgi:DNA gyrase inhibitor GyrI
MNPAQKALWYIESHLAALLTLDDVDVADFSDLPREFACVRIPEQKYAMFTNAGRLSTICRTVNTIWNHWLPASGIRHEGRRRAEFRALRRKI